MGIGLFALIGLPGLAMYGGYKAAVATGQVGPDELARTVQDELDSQRAELQLAAQTAQENLNALAIRLGQMQAHIIRLDALGQRLTQMANLDDGEFDFESSPAQGGPEIPGPPQAMDIPDFVRSLNDLSQQIEDRSQKLGVMESLLMNRNLQAEVMPAGRPISSGWLSSHFGTRTDPFSGRRVHHNGVDFAAKEGSDVIAVAAGVVTYAGRRTGYGKLVELNHGNGYVTRYAHHKEILVEIGDTVKKGQRIALVGSTGRSTGPHVHFEVWHNGRVVDPVRYIRAAR